MPIVAITREMGSLGKDVARALGAELNTQRVSIDECVAEVLALVRSPQFAETRAGEVGVSSESGRVTLSGAGDTDEMLALVEIASAVPGVRDVAYRTNPGEELRPRFH